MKKIYLASPYSDDDPEVERKRFESVCKIAASLISEGCLVFCPIAHSHPIHIHGDMRTDSGYWAKLNESWLDWCDELWIANMPNWHQSKGIRREMKYAKKIGKKIEITKPYGYSRSGREE